MHETPAKIANQNIAGNPGNDHANHNTPWGGEGLSWDAAL